MFVNNVFILYVCMLLNYQFFYIKMFYENLIIVTILNVIRHD